MLTAEADEEGSFMCALRRLLALLGVVAVLAACSDGGSDPGRAGGTDASSTEPLGLSGSWVLTSGRTTDGDLAPVEGADVTLDVAEDGTVSGVSACNRYTGQVTVEGAAVTFGPLASTRMACLGDLMVLETAYLAALDRVTTGAREGDVLTLRGDGVALTFAPSP